MCFVVVVVLLLSLSLSVESRSDRRSVRFVGSVRFVSLFMQHNTHTCVSVLLLRTCTVVRFLALVGYHMKKIEAWYGGFDM